jgi:CubicO group peptidase (beta-lactamase class C family)
MLRWTALVLVTTLTPIGAVAEDRAALEFELERLRHELKIPSMSAAVVEGGTTVWVRHFGIKTTAGDPVRYPIASLTKPFTAVLALQLVDRGKLRLDDVRPLLSHTSTGVPGSRFVYSSEMFQTLKPALERAAGASLQAALLASIVRPAGLRQTVVPASVTPSGGIESTVDDLARFAVAIERGALGSAHARGDMFRPLRGPTGQPMPYALGWFVQYIGGEEIRWHYGQQGDASSLLMMVPRRRLTFVILARTDHLSAPFWLQMGDLRWSPAAAAFLTTWPRIRIDLAEARRWMTKALIAIYNGAPQSARDAVRRALGLAPALGDSADGTLLAAFARSADAELHAAGRRIAKRLLAVDASHPRTLLDFGVLQLQDGQVAEGKRLLRQVVEQGNATPEIKKAAEALLQEGS